MGWHASGESESMNSVNSNIPNHMAWTIVSTIVATFTCCPLGLLGIVVPVLPGLLLVWGAVGIWAAVQQDLTGWVALGITTVFLITGSVVKYLLPGRRLRASGVPWRSLASRSSDSDRGSPRGPRR